MGEEEPQGKMSKGIVLNILVLASLLAYLMKLSFFSDNPGFFWRALIFSLVFTVSLLAVYRFRIRSIYSLTGIFNVFMFLFVVAATVPIDGIWCLSYGHSLINPASCGGAINYGNLWDGMFGAESSYSPSEHGVCKRDYHWIESSQLCTKSRMGFYQHTVGGQKKFDYHTLILNLGWILFPISVLFAYTKVNRL